MGDVADEMRQRGMQLCRSFMGGAWAELQPADFNIQRLPGGLSNMMYICTLADHIPTEDKDEPRQVVLRIYGQIIQENPETVVTDSVIFGLLAEKKLGPKLYGVFTGGRVEEYVPSRHLYTQELRQPQISEACAKIMTDFHKLKMPLSKKPKWLYEVISRYLDDALNNVSFTADDPDKRAKLQQIFSYGLASEYKSLKSLLDEVQSPVVFCHNDLQEGNILYKEHTDNGTGWELVPIDFEYASYNFRGFDIANHMCEWCYDYDVDDPPYYTADIEKFASLEEQMRFINAYRSRFPSNKCDKTMTDEFMLREIMAFTMASDFMWGLWSLVQVHISDIKFGYLEYAMARFQAYFQHKKQYLETYCSINGK